ncbi:MAG: division/cell wall cluster transcriptional repressor MraZ [Treponema sp.]|nr:division/cell wall cluster transcriptional repressor MraZ [Treponema sp.]
MNLLYGEYRVTLDEKGRILFPAKLRSALTENSLFITKSLDNCLWLYTPERWNELQTGLMENTSSFSARNRQLLRRLLAPAQEVEFDKAGRLSIPQILREYAALSKDCVIAGVGRNIELWDAETYRKNLDEFEPSLEEAAQELSDVKF